MRVELLQAAFGLTHVLLSLKASCPKRMKQRVGGERGVLGRAAQPCLAGPGCAGAAPNPPDSQPSISATAFLINFFAFLNAFDGLQLLEHHGSAERLSEVLED